MNQTRQRTDLGTVIQYVTTIIVYIFLYAPIVCIIAYSFSKNPMFIFPIKEWSFRWWITLANDYMLQYSTINSLFLGFATSLISAILGAAAAFYIVRTRFKGKDFLYMILLLPLILPPLVYGVSLLSFFSLLGWTMSMLTAIIGHVCFTLPFVVVVVSISLYGFDRSLEEAAMDLGADRFQVMRYITLPLISQAVMSGILTSFIFSFNELIISMFLVGKNITLPTYMWSMWMRGVTPELNAISTVIIMIVLFVTLIFPKIFKIKAFSN